MLKKVFLEITGTINKSLIHERVYQRHIKSFESPESDTNYEDLDTYLRIYIYRHLSKCYLIKKIFGCIDNLLSCKNIYK